MSSLSKLFGNGADCFVLEQILDIVNIGVCSNVIYATQYVSHKLI